VFLHFAHNLVMADTFSVDEHVAFVKEYLASPGWIVTYNRDGVEGSRKPLTGSPIETYKSTGIVNVGVKEATEKVYTMGFKGVEYI